MIRSPLTGWGRYPRIEAAVLRARREAEVSALACDPDRPEPLIPRGLGRSYGDSALASTVLDMRQLDHFHSFDEDNGLLCCSAGVTLGEILSAMVPRGWFVPVLPGTRHVTVGGAIASDVHGKNHHLDGSFTDHVEFIDLCLASGEIRRCSPREEPVLFRATCGGMGLTGVVVRAGIRLRRVAGGQLVQKTAVARNLREIFELFEDFDQATYSVAWLDCMASGTALGRSLLFCGEHEEAHGKEPGETGEAVTEAAVPPSRPRLSVPFDMPGSLLNRYSISLFNQLYYRLGKRGQDQAESPPRKVDYGRFFFPLDNIAQWNRLYGRKGFIQYQFVVPAEAGLDGVSRILSEVTAAGKGSFLSVLKKFGPGNENMLSFPMAGYTLALDFRMENSLLPLLDRLDQIVLECGGRLYLAKDARMSRETFRRSYPRWEEFAALRESVGARQRFHSLQSTRLGL